MSRRPISYLRSNFVWNFVAWPSPHRSRSAHRLYRRGGAAAAVTGAVLSPLVSADAAQEHHQHNAGKSPKSVIFINGDGMSAAHREAARLYLQGLDGKLRMDRLPESGNLTTDSRDPKTYVTDSAAAATAWATGHKTYNGAISVDVNRNPLPTLGMQAKKAGKAPAWSPPPRSRTPAQRPGSP